MSVCWFDYDNDGREDLYVANMWTAAGERISTLDTFQPGDARARPRPVSQACHGQLAVAEAHGPTFSQVADFDGGEVASW